MSVSTAIGQVSTSLRRLLVGEMLLSPAVDVTILAPDERGGDRRINLFLYRVEENPFLRNLDWTVKPGDPAKAVPTPLSLNLYYLVTPYARNDPQTGNSTAHEILGEAMRVLYENPVIPDNYLETGLKAAREELKLIHKALDPEELSRIWGTFSQPFRLSVLYQVSTVQLDLAPDKERVLPKRVQRVGVPSVRAPFQPPSVLDMDPARGPTGTSITFTGQNLTGWQATVRAGGLTALDRLPLAANRFTATVPAALQPGFYDVRVDVSRLFRRVFLFEVTA